MIRSAILPLRINIKSIVPPAADDSGSKEGKRERESSDGSAGRQAMAGDGVDVKSTDQLSDGTGESDACDSDSSESLTSTIVSTTQHGTHVPVRPSSTATSSSSDRKKVKKSSNKKKSKKPRLKSKRKHAEDISSDDDSTSWSQVFRKKSTHKKSKSEASGSWYDLQADAIPDPKSEAVKSWIEQSHVSVTGAAKAEHASFKMPELPVLRRDRHKECDRRHRHRDRGVRERSPDRWRSQDQRFKERHEKRHNGLYDDRYSERWHRKRERQRDDFHRSVSVSRSTRSASRSRHIYTEAEKIDKDKLLSIARANLSRMMSMGALPKGVDVERFKLRHLKELAASQSLKEYTEFCRAISAMEAAAYSDSSLSGSDDSDDEVRSVICEATFAGRHPFALMERKEIQIKARDFVPLAPRSAQQIQSVLLNEFPVDSGDKHRLEELEWKDVTEITTPVSLPIKEKAKPSGKTKEQPDDSLAFRREARAVTISESSGDSAAVASSDVVTELLPGNSVSQGTFDVGRVMSQRLSAMRVLQTEPFNVIALKQMREAQEQMDTWSKSGVRAGQLTGSTAVKTMSHQELNAGQSVGVHKDTLRNTKAIRGGIGRHLMEKMGWREGQGLGAKEQGTVVPILLAIKLDTKGLATDGERVKSLDRQVVPGVPLCDGDRVPVAMLHSYCMTKGFRIPMYELIEESGPAHKKNFVMRVLVNDIFYQPTVSSLTKKQAKHLAAIVCLQAFGLLSKEPAKVQLTIDAQ